MTAIGSGTVLFHIGKNESGRSKKTKQRAGNFGSEMKGLVAQGNWLSLTTGTMGQVLVNQGIL